jgi:hypothetical protein
MKTKEDLNADILTLMLKIKNTRPELSKYIDEMTITIPNKSNPEINIDSLKDYYQSLEIFYIKYEQEHNPNFVKN